MPSQDRIPFAHVLRGLAALSVVLFHYLGVFWTRPDAVAGLLNAPAPAAPASIGFLTGVFGPHAMFSAGDFGVALFFLISGFVIPFSFSRQSRLGFLVARAWRLWPTYAAGLTITLAWLFVVTRVFGRAWPHGASVIAWHYALGLRDLAGSPSLDGIVWTLEVEIRFYLLCVLLAPALRSGRALWPIVTAVALVAGTAAVDLWWAGAPGVGGSWTIPAYALGLDGQMLTYMLIGTFFNLHLRGRVTTGALAGLTLATGAAVAWLWGRGPLAIEFWPGVVSYAAALALFAACYAWRSRISAWGPLAWLADVSYPLYVVHAMPGYAIMRLLLEAGAPAGIALAVAFTSALVSATLLHRWIERPTHARGRAWAAHLADEAMAGRGGVGSSLTVKAPPCP